MGLLDALAKPEVSQGLLGMAAGLLTPGDYGAFGPSLGRGLLGFSRNIQQAQEQQTQVHYRKMQMQVLQQNAAQQQQRQALIGSLLGTPYQQPAAGILASHPSGSTTGGPQQPTGGILAPAQTFPVSDTPSAPAPIPAPSAGQSAGQSPLDRLPPEVKQRVAFDLMFNGGKGIADILKPNVSFQNGVAVDMNTVKPGFSVPTTNANGMATVTKQNPDGTWSVTAPNGAVSTYRSYQEAQQDAQASHDLVQVVDSKGNTRLIPKSTAINQANGGSGGKPLIASRNPAEVQYDTDVAKQTAKQYNQIQAADQEASTKIAQYQQLESLLANTSLSKTGYEIANFASKNGLLPDVASNSLGNAQAATALSNRLALTLRSTAEGGGMPGAMSDPDRQFLMQQVPQLETTPEGRHQMIGMLVAIEKRNQQIAQMARDWRKGGGRLDNPDANGKTFFDYLQAWSNANTLFPNPQK